MARIGRDPAGRDPPHSLSLLGTADSIRAAARAQAVHGPSQARPGGLPPSLSLLGIVGSVMAATHAQAVCGPDRVGPGGEGPCSLPLAARYSQHCQGRNTCFGCALPKPGETRRGGALLPPPSC